MKRTHRCQANGPCLVPAHPDLQGRLLTESVRLQTHPDAVPDPSLNLLHSGSSPLSLPSGIVPGLNDGTIFPRSHFDSAPSQSVLSRAALERTPLRGAIKAAVILVDFSDKPMADGALQRFQDLFFSTGRIAKGSVTEYYADVSGSKISLTGEVVGPYRMPLKLADYAHGANGFGSVAPNLQNLAADALAASDGQINFGPYDNDGNGYADAFIVVHAGSGAEETGNVNDIWSAKWILPNETPVDGVKVYGFLTIPEDALIGVCAHELGHLLFGWPDLYDIDYSSQGVGNWCLMSGGSWGGSPAGSQPCHPSAWCKVNQGWVNLVTETQNGSISLGDVKTAREVHRLWKGGDTASTEYFLLENREQAGFDQSLPGSGLLIWHVDDAIDSNRDENHPKVALMQADGLSQLKISNAGRGDAGDPFPGSSNNTSFTSTSNPNSKNYTSQDTSVSVTSISGPAQTMTMNIAVQPNSSWLNFQLATAPSVATGTKIAAVSRIPDSMEVWWIAANGSVQDAYWYSGSGWNQFELAPAGSASTTGGVAAVSRIPGSMEVWWVSPSGSVEGAYWYDGSGWKSYQCAPAGSAAVSSKIAAVSRIQNSMEIWWIGPDGSVQDANWYDGSGWNHFQLAPAGSAAAGGIDAVCRIPGSMEIWWVAPNGSVQDAYWYDGSGWNQFELASAGSAAPGTSIASVSRIPDSMELWWAAPNGSVQDAYWYNNAGWNRFELAPAGSAATGGIEAVSRIQNFMEVWWTAPNGSVQDAYWEESNGWKSFELAPTGSAGVGSGFACVSRIQSSMEIWFAGQSGSLIDSYWYA